MDFLDIFLPLIPITWLFVANLVFFVALNISQSSRILIFPILIGPAICSFATMRCFVYPLGLDSTWGVGIVIWIAHATLLLYIDKIPAPTIYRKSWDAMAAYKLALNFRLLDTSRGSRSATRTEIWQFTAIQLGKLVAYCLLMTCIVVPSIAIFFGAVSIQEFDDFHTVYFRRLLWPAESTIPAVTARETYLRAVFTLRWVCFAIIELDASHIFCSLFFVSVCRLDPPTEWPLLFGSPTEAYGIRRFWGKMWHRLSYKPYGTPSRMLSRKVLGLRPNSNLDKTLVAFFTFLISGAAHSCVSWYIGNPHCLGDITFFCSNFAAMAVEIFITGRFRRVFSHLNKSWFLRLCGMILGFVWTFGFLFWIVPKWQYPVVYSVLLEQMQLASQERLAGMADMFT